MNDMDDKEISKALNILSELSESCKNEKLCEMTEEQKECYRQLLKKFKEANSRVRNVGNSSSSNNILKGKALEDLVDYLLKVSGDIFSVDRNLRTTTNEIDQLVVLNVKGKILMSYNLVNRKLANFLCECKNYDKKVSVTYIGKFCSLLLTNQTTLGILFSFYGASGNNWSNASGLIKKFYLHKEKLEDRYCIIDFNFLDFQSILEGKNLLQIIDEKLLSLQYDTDYTKFVSRHPAEISDKN